MSKIRLQRKMVPEYGIELEGVLNPDAGIRLHSRLRMLGINAQGCAPQTQSQWFCIPVDRAGWALEAMEDYRPVRGGVWIPLELLALYAENDDYEFEHSYAGDAAQIRAMCDHGLLTMEGSTAPTKKMKSLMHKMYVQLGEFYVQDR
jgi:hypothetical protein